MALIGKAKKLSATLVDNGIRAECDIRDNISPGWKFNHWELKGVPVRIEVGPRDLANNQVIEIGMFNYTSYHCRD